MTKRLFSLVAASLFIQVCICLIVPFHTAQAASFNQNNIIDDAVFNNANSMSQNDIQNFLNKFPNSCLKNYSDIYPNNYFDYSGNASAAAIIKQAANTWGINPQVILSTLEKEESLVSGNAGCSSWRYNSAVGMGCPDNGVCPSAPYAGFSRQVMKGMWQLKFNEERSYGNTTWDDDNNCTYSGFMTAGYRARIDNGALIYYDGYATIDGTPVYMNNGATAALYTYTPHFSGNQSFFNIFTGWFGSTTLPQVYKAPQDSTVYIQIDGQRFAVPSMSILQDYGFSPSSIGTISQDNFDLVPSPKDGLSSSVGYIIKSNSEATVYLVAVGKKYAFTSMDQLYSYGYTENDIKTLPDDFVSSISSGTALNGYISSPTSNVFKVSNGHKQIIFDYSLYISMNASGIATPVSYALADTLPSGSPITNRDILVSNTNGSVWLFNEGSSYVIPSMQVYGCWGFGLSQDTPLYKLAFDNYVNQPAPQATLTCNVSSDNSSYLMDGTQRVKISSSFSQIGTSLSSSLEPIADRLQMTNSEASFIKTLYSSTVWMLSSGKKNPIPSIEDLQLLDPGDNITVLKYGDITNIPTGALALGPGRPVKVSGDGTVYVITNDNDRVAFTSADDFLAYGYSWSSILDTTSQSFLDSYYPQTNKSIQKFVANKNNDIFLIDRYGCYNLDSQQIIDYGVDISSVTNKNALKFELFPYLSANSCRQASKYVKSSDSATIWKIVSGKKEAISSWSQLISDSGQLNPYIIVLSDTNIGRL